MKNTERFLDNKKPPLCLFSHSRLSRGYNAMQFPYLLVAFRAE